MNKVIRYFPVLILVCFFSSSWAQSDSSGYQLQRIKINALLMQRSAKFGQYEQSLNARTGIFGFQTKNDIKNSNEILREIALNDNNIFRELKVLMAYKDMQVQQVQNTAMINNDRIQRYTQAIKKLQDNNYQLRQQVKKQEQKQNLIYYTLTFVLLFCLTAIIFLMRKLKMVRN